MRRVAQRLGLRAATRYGRVDELDRETPIVILAHSLLGFALDRPFRGLRVIRDPRDIWVSSYLYHRRCPEGWCVNTDLRAESPIGYPRVDFSMMHRPERWKRDYLGRLGTRSYQQNLLDRDTAEGLAFELDNYTGCTLEAMRAWRPHPAILDVRLEDIAADFDVSMRHAFRHLGFDEATVEVARQCAASRGCRADGRCDPGPKTRTSAVANSPSGGACFRPGRSRSSSAGTAT